MQNPIYEKIGEKYGISPNEVEKQISNALQNTDLDVAQLLYTLSNVLIKGE